MNKKAKFRLLEITFGYTQFEVQQLRGFDDRQPTNV